MNKIYRAIWNETTQTWVAASELAKSKTKANTVSAQTSVRSLIGKISLNTFKVGMIASLVNMSLAIPNAYAADRSNVNGYYIWGNAGGQVSVNAFVLQGDDNVCGHDIVAGRGNSLVGLSALEEYKRFAQNSAFVYYNKTYNPYGETTKVENWTGDGTTSGNSGYQGLITGATNTNGSAYGVNSFVYGCGSYATGNHSLAFGTNATSKAGGAQAFGVAALASGRASNAIGVSSQAAGVSAVALGSVANADGVGSVALGLQSNAAADGAVAVGVQSQAKGNSAVAIGNSNVADAKESISIGSGNAVLGVGSIAVGNSGAATKFNSADGLQAAGASDYTRIKGNYTLSLGNSNSGADTNSDITAANTTIFGNNNHINDAIDGAHIIGNRNTVSVAADVTGSGTIVIGNDVNVSAKDTLALGNNTTVNGIGAIAVGNQAKATADGAVALGSGSLADRAENTAGYNPDTDSDASTPVWKSTSGAVTVGNSERDITRQITDVAAGTQDTDAINVAQLKNLSSSVSGSVSSLSTSLEAALPPTNTAIESVSSSVFDNITEIDRRINSTSLDTNEKLRTISTNISELETSSATGIDSLKQVALLYKDGAYNAGSSDNRVSHKIINVAAPAQLSADSTDMVNGGQLYTTNSVLSSLSSTISTGLNILNVDASSFELSVSTSVNAIDKRIDKLASSNNDISKLRQTILAWDGEKAFASDEEKKITGVADGNIDSIDSTDAVTGKQLRATNTLVNKVKQDVNDSLTKNEIAVKDLELKAKEQLTASFDNYKALSTSVSTGISQITRDAFLYNDTKGVYEADTNKPLQKISNVAEGDAIPGSSDAITGGQLYKTNVSLSTVSFSISTQLSSITKGRGDLSTGASTDLSSLSTTISTSLDNLTSSTSSSLKTLNSNLQGLSSSTSTAISDLRKNTILRDEADLKFHATHQGVAQKITGVAPADISNPNSTDMVNGGQLYTTNSNITSLSSTVISSFSSLSNSLSASVHQQLTQVSTNLNVVNDKISALQTDALQWNENAQAYSARHDHDGKVEDQKITHVQAGDIASLTSTDAVTGGQYYDLNTSIDTRVGELKTSALSSVDDVNKDISTLQRQMLRLAGDSFNAQRVEQNQKITGVAKATLNSASTDAVNGALLYSTSVSLSTLANSAASHLFDLRSQLKQNSDNTLQNGTSLVNGLNASISTLQKEVMQWNGSDKAFSANYGIAGKQRITNVAAGNVAPGSTEAIIMAQIHSFSTSTASAIEKVNQELNGVSASEIKKLAAAIENGFKTPNSNIATLKQNALQWNSSLKAYDASHGQVGGKNKITNVDQGNVHDKSTDAVIGDQLVRTNTSVATLSTSLDSGLSSLSSSVASNLTSLSSNLNNSLINGLNSFSTAIDSSLATTDASLSTIKQNALLWNGSFYDASDASGNKARITNVAKGDTQQNSKDAVIGAQLYSTNNQMSLLSTSFDQRVTDFERKTKHDLGSLSTVLQNSSFAGLDSLSTATDTRLKEINDKIPVLQQNALQWTRNSDGSGAGVYDASHGVLGDKNKITNVLDGSLNKGSKEAVTGNQLYNTNTAISDLAEEVESGVSTLTSSLHTISDKNISTLTGLLQQTSNKLTDLSATTATELNSISSGISSLQNDALQWKRNSDDSGAGTYDASHGVAGAQNRLTHVAAGNVKEGSSDAVTGAQLFSTNSSISSLDTKLVNVSDSISTGISSLSSSLSSVINSNLNKLTDNKNSIDSDITNLSSSVSSALSATNNDLTALKQDALQWKNGAYDASHGKEAGKHRITNVAKGDVYAGSTDAITAGQLYTTDSEVDTLSGKISERFDSFSTTLSSLVNLGISSLSTGISDIDARIGSLQQNTLQWNASINAYDAGSVTGNTAKITHVAAGLVGENSSDAIIGDQLSSLSTASDANLASLSASMSISISTIQDALTSASGSYLNQISSLSSSMLHNIGNLSASSLTDLSSLSNSASNSIAELSSSTDASLSSASSTIFSSLNSLSTTIETGISSLSLSTLTSANHLTATLNTVDGDLGSLKQDTLQWNDYTGGYSADHGTGQAQKITNVAAGNVAPNSTDAINGHQLDSLSTSVASTAETSFNSLSTTLDTSIDKLGNKLDNFSTNTIQNLNKLNTNLISTSFSVSVLKDNALQWDSSLKAYDASHNGSVQLITNISAGAEAVNSTEAVNGGQFFSLSNSTSTGLSSLSTNLSSVINNQLGSLSSIVTNDLSVVNKNISSLSTGLDSVTDKVTALQKDVLQWDKVKGAYNADHGTNTAQLITSVSAGTVDADSTDVINAAQLHSLSISTTASVNDLNRNLKDTNTALNTLSTTTETSLTGLTNSLSDTKKTLNQLSTDTAKHIQDINGNLTNLSTATISSLQNLNKGLQAANTSVATLQDNALQWNAGKGVYDASREGSAKILSGIDAGAVNANSTEAVNGGQLHSLSTVTQTGLTSASTGLSSLSLSTVTGLNSLSSSLSSTKQDLITLQANALQWNGSAYDASHGGSAQRITNVAAGFVTADSTDVINGSQFFSLSNSTSTGLSSLSTNLSAVTDNQLGGLSSIVADGFSTVTGNVSKLSTSLSTTNSNIILLQQNALQRNRISGDFDARRDDNDQNLTGIAAGDINATSSDAINATQMHSLSTLTQAGLNSTSTGLSSLSSSTVSGLNAANTRLDSLSTVTQAGLVSASTGLSSLSLSTTTDLNNLTASLNATNQNLTSLQQNALQWNGSAYDASHGGSAQRITNVAAGRMAADSTDAVNGGQLFSLSSSTSTGLNSLSTVISTTVISEINNINSSISTGYDSLSISLSTTKDDLDKLTSSTSTGLSSLSTASQKIRKDVDYLKENSLQWNNDEDGFDAGKPNNLTRAPIYRKIINVEEGKVEEGSHEVVV
ncbi:ESPR-type extended signal peptide-containing protein, partial [Snodgrassella communis]|uniref:ESPR-type extended signal peptide-containing protein n=1 Tax=Snodgrassella communis TaxID=2946699 RepID=UPI001EF6790A